MKMMHHHYTLLEHDIAQLPLCEIMRECAERGYSDMAARWEVFHQANMAADYFFGRLHDYLNDNHIDTALRKIMKELMREKVK